MLALYVIHGYSAQPPEQRKNKLVPRGTRAALVARGAIVRRGDEQSVSLAALENKVGSSNGLLNARYITRLFGPTHKLLRSRHTSVWYY